MWCRVDIDAPTHSEDSFSNKRAMAIWMCGDWGNASHQGHYWLLNSSITCMHTYSMAINVS